MENISFPDQWLTIAAERMRGLPEPVLGRPNLPDIHIASSMLQKALRRSHGPNAHRAARYMLAIDPSRLWRRLVVVAFEDFGPTHPELLAIVCAISSNAKWRRQNGSDGKAVAFVIDLLLGAVRDRLVDHCYMVAIGVTGSYCPTEYASQIVQPILREAIKAVQKCELVIPPQQFRSLLPKACDAVLLEIVSRGEITHSEAELYRQGYRSSRCLLPVVAAIVRKIVSPGCAVRKLGSQPECADIAGVPGYALDGYTRIGNMALAITAKKRPGLARVLQAAHPSIRRAKALSALLFAAEGGICTAEVQSPVRDELRAIALSSWSGLPVALLEEAIGEMSEAIPTLNEVRAQLAPEMTPPRQMELWNEL